MAEVMGYLQSEQIRVFTKRRHGDPTFRSYGFGFAFQIHTDLGTIVWVRW